jgi:hypothetical protein
MQAQMDAMMRMLGGGAGGSGSEGAPDMNNFFAQLMGGMPPGAGPNLLGDGSDAGAAFDPNANPFANMAGMQGMGAGFPGMAGMPGMPGFAPPQPPSKAARFLPLIHAIAVIALVVFVAAWWEPTLALVRWGSKATLGSWATRWSSLAGRTGSYGVKNVEGMVSHIPSNAV